MKKFITVFAIGALALTTVAGCTSAKKDSTTDTKKEEKVNSTFTDTTFNVGFVTDIGGIDDKSFNQGTYEGIKKFVLEDNTKRAVKYIQSNADADYAPNIETLSKDKTNLVIAAGYLFVDAIGKAAKDNPKSNYLIIDQEVKAPNVVSAMFAEDEGAFLAGYAAGLTAKEAKQTKLGFIGGAKSDVITRFETGWIAGVKYAYPEATVAIEYVGDFKDDAKGKTIANKMYKDGVFAIHVAAGGAGNGVIAAAKELTEKGEVKWVIGVDRDQYTDGLYGKDKKKSAVLTSVVKGVDVAAYEVSKLTEAKKFPGGTTIKYDVKSGGIGIPATNPNLSDDISKKTEAVKKEIVDGKLKVADKIKELVK